jgi:hypothetical protein
MRYPVDRAVRPGGGRSGSTARAGASSPAVVSSLVGRGLPGPEGGLKTETTCSACSRDLGAPDLNYRLVLRCTSMGRT